MAKAQFNLGMAYRAGAGVEKDNVQAYFWIAIAASSLEQGFVKDYRDKVEAVLTPAQLADVQERVRKFERGASGHADSFIKFLAKRPSGSTSSPATSPRPSPGPTTGSRTRPIEAGIPNIELRIEIGVSDSIGVQGGTPELEEIRTGARLERQGKDGCRDYGENGYALKIRVTLRSPAFMGWPSALGLRIVTSPSTTQL